MPRPNPATPAPAVPPVLAAFLALWAGTALAGLLGPLHGLLLGVFVALSARAVLALRGLRPWSGAAPLALLAALGALRLGLEPLPRPVGAGLPPPPGAVRAEVEVLRVGGRHRLATWAEARLLSLDAPAEAVDPPPDGLVRLRARGFLDLPAGRVLAVTARWLPPAAPAEALPPAWPGPPARPTLVLVSPSDALPLSGPGLPERSPLDRLRATLATRLRLHLTGPGGDFALAVLLGEGGGIDASTRADLAALGTAHVLSVSGLHVAAAAVLAGLLVVRLLGPLLARLRPGTNLAALHQAASVAAATGVALLAGAPAPAVRSAGMFAVGAAGAALARPATLATAAGATGLASLLAWPRDAFDLSFLLSYAAILGLALLVPPLQARLMPERWQSVAPRDLPRSARAARALLVLAAASVAATLATAPLTLLAFRQAGPAGPLANLVAIPWTTLVVMPVALAFLLAAAAVPALLPLLAPPTQAVLDSFLASQVVLARALPALADPSPAVLALSLAGSVGAIVAVLRPRPFPVLVSALVAAAIAGAFDRPSTRPPADALSVRFLDVGKGDAALVRCPSGRAFLVDAAEARAADGPRGLVARLRAAGVDALDGLVLTHADEDHVGGTVAVLGALAVGEVVAPCPVLEDPPLRDVLAAARAGGVTVRCVVAGVEPLPGCGDPAPALWPPALTALHGNAASLVFRLSWRGRSVLMTGDLEAEGEEALLDAGAVPRADVLKLGHHGSPGASTPAFLAAVGAARVVVSGFRTRRLRDLSPETARRVRATGAALLTTSGLGDVTVLLGADGSLAAGGTRTPGPRRR